MHSGSPFHVVALPLRRKTVEAVGFRDLVPLIIRFLLMFLIMSVVAIDLWACVSDLPLTGVIQLFIPGWPAFPKHVCV